VLGSYEDGWLFAVQENRLYKIRARAIVFATGAYEQPLVFDGNDLPGVILGGAAARLVHLYGVSPGRRAVVVTAHPDGWHLAADLQRAGVTIAGVVDQRPAAAPPPGVNEDLPFFPGHTILAARGSKSVESAAIVPLKDGDVTDPRAPTWLSCDLVVLNVGWAPATGLLSQSGAKTAFNPGSGEFTPTDFPPGIYAAGRAAGTHELDAQLREGHLAGARAAAFAGAGSPPSESELTALERQKGEESRRTSTLVRTPVGGKRFVCFCEDVTEKDIHTAIAEGYDRIELLKRYSTISMGPCQGKMCSTNTIHLCARANGKTVAATGTTTARPPSTPVKLGALAGQNMEPLRRTSLHEWHETHGAKMMVAGLWMRPEHYGDPGAEVRAVRERVGLIDVSTLGKLRLSGAGAPGLLERLYTNRWRDLPAGRVRYGIMCNDEGVILDDGVSAHLGEDEWYTTTTSSGATSVYEWIQWWLQSGWGAQVHVIDASEAYSAFNLAGPRSREVLSRLAEVDISREAFPYLGVRSIHVAGVPCIVLRVGFTGELSYEIHAPAAYGRPLWEALMQAGEDFGIQPFGIEAQRVLRLEKGHIIVGQDTDALTDPLSADLAWSVKAEKEDFLGIRALHRIAEEGPSQRLVGFKTGRADFVPAEGLQVVRPLPDGGLEIIGWVTSSRFSPTLGEAIGLCWLPSSLAGQAGAAFNIRVDGRLEQAHVHHGPFYDPEGERLRA
jgi:sarcosine oxidase subunit alpha